MNSFAKPFFPFQFKDVQTFILQFKIMQLKYKNKQKNKQGSKFFKKQSLELQYEAARKPYSHRAVAPGTKSGPGASSNVTDF